MITDKISILNQTTLDSLKEKTEREIIKKFFGVATELLDANFGFIWLKKPGSKKMELIHKSHNLPFNPTIPRKSGTTYRVLQKKRSLLINRISESKSVQAFAKKYLEGLAIIPITYRNHTYGNMYICFKRAKKFTAEDKILCDAIGNTFAQTLTINRLNRDLQDLKQTLDHTTEPLLIFDPDSQNITYYNKGLVDQTGLKKSELNRAHINKVIHSSYQKVFEKRLKHILAKKVPTSVFEVVLTSPARRKLPAEISLQYVQDLGQSAHLVATFRDLKERKKSEQEIKKAAYHDTLTNLPNRFLFTKQYNALLNSSRQYGRKFAVIFMDLDKFKFVNDTLGHLMGDQLLREVARRIRKNLKRKDTVSRLGGDEFVILLTNIKSVKQTERVAKRIKKAFETSFKLSSDLEIYVNFSMGISVYPKDGIDGPTLLKNADNALYRAKQQGGKTYEYHYPEFVVKQNLIRKRRSN